MIISDGKNAFPDNQFSFWEWSAPILQTPEEVVQQAHELRIVGRVVKDIVAIGLGYNWTFDGIEESAYNSMERLHPLLKSQIPNPEAVLPKGVDLPCFAELDEPLLIIFEDGDSLGISFDEGSCVRMGLNTIPPSIEPGVNRKNFHANRLFQEMLGKRITSVEVTSSTEYPEFTGSHGLELDEQPCYISKVDIVFDDNSHYRPRKRLSFSAWWDYGWVEIVDHSGQTLGIPSEKVPWIVEGFISSEELKG